MKPFLLVMSVMIAAFVICWGTYTSQQKKYGPKTPEQWKQEAIEDKAIADEEAQAKITGKKTIVQSVKKSGLFWEWAVVSIMILLGSGSTLHVLHRNSNGLFAGSSSLRV